MLIYSAVGTKVGSFQRSASVLGIKHVAWSPNGRHLALGGYDGVVRVLESESWQPISVVKGFENGALVEPSESEKDGMVHCESVTVDQSPSCDCRSFQSNPKPLCVRQDRLKWTT